MTATIPEPNQAPATRSVPSRVRVFRRLLAGETIGHFGIHLAILAIPTYAIEHLNASPSEISILNMLQWLPPMLFVLLAGRIADRKDRVRVVVGSDLAYASAALLVAGLIFAGSPSLALLFILVAVMAVCGTFQAVSVQALLPGLLSHADLPRGNARLGASKALAQMGGQFLATHLLSLAAGALVIFIEAIAHLLRALLIGGIARPIAPKTTNAAEAESGAAPVEPLAIRSSWNILRSQPELIKLIGAQGTLNLGGAFILGFFLLYAYDVLGLKPGHIALMLGIGSGTAFLGAIAAGRLLTSESMTRVGLGALVLAALSVWLLVAARWGPPLPFLLVYEALFSLSSAVFAVVVVSRRQQLTPMAHQGRIGSFAIFGSYASLIVGGSLAALFAPMISLHVGIAVGCSLSSITFLWFVIPTAWLSRRGDSISVNDEVQDGK